ncbi:MAG: hypothetical protein ACXWJA_15565 [Caldimonas sp.]
MTLPGAPTCPACGFRVYNRRYPNCESCGAALPESLVYSSVERHALLVADEERALDEARRERSAGEPLSTSLDEAIVSAVMGLTEK